MGMLITAILNEHGGVQCYLDSYPFLCSSDDYEVKIVKSDRKKNQSLAKSYETVWLEMLLKMLILCSKFCFHKSTGIHLVEATLIIFKCRYESLQGKQGRQLKLFLVNCMLGILQGNLCVWPYLNSIATYTRKTSLREVA